MYSLSFIPYSRMDLKHTQSGDVSEILSSEENRATGILQHRRCRKRQRHYSTKTFDTGIEHGTITVLLNHEGYEVTTYRIDGKYEDSRHPKEVTFTRNLKEDLLRRDFTINAMAYNDKDGIVDIFGGMQDLEKHMIRCVGNAKERFSEDALRILRGVRFAAQLGFEIDEETKEGMKLLAPTLENISAERIQVELVKMLTSDRPELIELLMNLGLRRYFCRNLTG